MQIKTRMGKNVLVFEAEVSEAQAMALCGVPLANTLKPVLAKAAKHSDDWDKVSAEDIRTHFPAKVSRKGEGDYALKLVSVEPWTPSTDGALTPEKVASALKSGKLALSAEQKADLAALLAS